MQLSILNHPSSGLGLEHLAVGHPMPAQFRSTGFTSITFHEAFGIVAWLNLERIGFRVRNVLGRGRLQAGVMDAGRHGTMLHVGSKLQGMEELGADFLFSLEHHRRAGGEDFRDDLAEDTRLCFAAVDVGTGIVSVLRQALLGKAVAAGLRADLDRQMTSAGSFDKGVHDLEAGAVLAACPQLTRKTCIAWDVLRDEA